MRGIPCTDHLGQQHRSFKAMCRHWGWYTSIVRQRLGLKWTLEEALTTQERFGNPIVDPWGTPHRSFYMMCKHHGVVANTVRKRLARDIPLRAALTMGRERSGRGELRGVAWARVVLDRWAASREAA